METAQLDHARTALKKYFGYDNFRPGQEEIIQGVYDKRDTLVLMPTGGGKSMCFQIPAITMEGMAVVVSPLISLMKDQVEGLLANGVEAAFLNSSQTLDEQTIIENKIYHGEIKLLYVSPEKMLSPNFLPILRQGNVNLFAIDEAHCISSWGHDFRPEYTQMKFLKKTFPDIPVIALTATADKITRRDITTQLGLENPHVFISSFDRPNLSLTVSPGQKRYEQIVQFVRKRRNTSGIIYCLSRKGCESLARKLSGAGYHADYYHAGMTSRERNDVQTDFINDKIPIVCATIAFGMGIDKSNVRWVIHYNMPKNLEGYYQEIGRAGRDGAPADTLLFYSYSDVMTLRDIIERNVSEQESIQLAKLERMQQYAEALICRRKILLNYFSENLGGNCGNCDICKNPPALFDGTIIAQKALSAVARAKEKIGVNLLIDILRGSRRREVLERGYDKIKTYGAGADISGRDWQYLIQQIINIGLLEIAYDHHHVLRLTDGAQRVLFGKQKIQLARMADVKERREKSKRDIHKEKKRNRVKNDLFKVLRQLRKDLARKKGIPPYIVFSDASLQEMAAELPVTEVDFRAISGVGDVKMEQYGPIFMRAIARYKAEQGGGKSADAKATLDEKSEGLIQLLKRGLPLTEIAMRHGLTPETVSSRLAALYANGADVELKRLISKTELKQILELMENLPDPIRRKDVIAALDGRMGPETVDYAMAYIERNG